jgi:hypothetical protein
MTDFRTHKQRLETDDDYRRSLGLPSLNGDLVRVIVDGSRALTSDELDRVDEAMLAADPLVASAHSALAKATTALMDIPAPYHGNGVDPALFRRLDTLNRLRLELKRVVDELKVAADEANDELVEQYQRLGTNEIEYSGRFGKLSNQIWARKVDESVTGEDVADALRADGLGHLVTPESYNSSQLSAYLRELDEAGQPIPPHLAQVIEANEKWRVGFTTRRATRAQRRMAGVRSSVVDGASED